MRKILLVVFVCGLMAAFGPTLQAVPLAFGQFFNGAATGVQLGNGPFTLGWSFDLTAPTTITDLAVFHDNGVGLLENHTVGIWDAAGVLHVTGTVIPADPCVLDQGGLQEWCTVAVRPITLPVGTYTIGATWNNLLDPFILPGTLAGHGIANFNGPNVVLLQNQYIFGAGLNDPTNSTGDNMSYFGPNFVSGVIPEPGTLVLLGSGLLGAVGVIRRKLS
jgi:hypothetical protein